jgi:flavodoxin/NAD-dependent dihydropyrimidine dehydrogenase PreA subunit
MFASTKVNIYYFSGTGNTELVARKIAEVLQAKGLSVVVEEMEKTAPQTVPTDRLLGLAFPVAVFSTYPLVWDFIRALPPGNGCPVFVVDTMGGFAGGVMGPLKTLLRRKGYQPIASREIIMPSNIFYIEPEKTTTARIRKGLRAAEVFAQEVLTGKGHWVRLPLLPDLVYYAACLVFWLMSWPLHQQLFKYKIKKELCTKCGICINSCPVDNITADQDGYPVYSILCQYCQRCVSLCPTGAIDTRFNFKGARYRAPKPQVTE